MADATALEFQSEFERVCKEGEDLSRKVAAFLEASQQAEMPAQPDQPHPADRELEAEEQAAEDAENSVPRSESTEEPIHAAPKSARSKRKAKPDRGQVEMLLDLAGSPMSAFRRSSSRAKAASNGFASAALAIRRKGSQGMRRRAIASIARAF